MMNIGETSHNQQARSFFQASRSSGPTNFIFRLERHNTLGCIEYPLLLIRLKIYLLKEPLNEGFHKVLHMVSLLFIICPVVHHHNGNRKKSFILTYRLKTELLVHIDILLLIAKHVEKDPLGVF